jgi:ketosteroid isomerase-like protein
MTVTAASPAELISLFADAMHDGRIDDAIGLYEPDATFYPAPDAAPVHGLDQIAHALQQFAALRPTMTGTVLRVTAAADIATVHNSWSLTGTAPDGAAVTMSATSADVMRRRADGSWGILIDDPWGTSGATA